MALGTVLAGSDESTAGRCGMQHGKQQTKNVILLIAMQSWNNRMLEHILNNDELARQVSNAMWRGQGHHQQQH